MTADGAAGTPGSLLLVGVGLFVAAVLVLAGAAALLDTVRAVIGVLAYLGLLGSLIAFIPLGDRYFTLDIWAVTASCFLLCWVLLGRIPLQSCTGVGAVLEFVTHSRNHHPRQTFACAALAVLLLASGFFRPRLGRGSSSRCPVGAGGAGRA